MRLTKLIIIPLAVVVVTTWFVYATSGKADETNADARLEEARAMVGPNWPVSSQERVTTSGAIYLSNLNGQITALEQRLKTRPNALLSAQLGRLLYHRFQVLGHLQDAESARDILATAAASAGGQVAVDYARVLIGFHEFDQADEILNGVSQSESDSAEPRSEVRAEVRAAERAIAQARGRLESISKSGELSPPSLSPVALVSQAAAWLDRGRPEKATSLLRLAQDTYTDSSPYTLAWIHTHQGIVFLDYKDYETARKFFAAAHQRFPQYTLAAEHLAETELALGNAEEAARLYRSVTQASGHPEFYFQLSRAEARLGNEELAQEAAANARHGYQELVAQYPMMYADHAVGYYMELGNREQAVELAQANYAQRQDKRSEELLATARECCR